MWRNVRYRNIPDFTYEVSNDGQIREWHTDNILKQKKMAQGKLYKSIMKEVERSTTIDNFVDQMMLEGYC